MPPESDVDLHRRLHSARRDLGDYPFEAYGFVQRGLAYTIQKRHGPSAPHEKPRHVSGQELCNGLREFALEQWGRLSRIVLNHWNIHTTLDFGRIVFSLVQKQVLSTTESDSIEDFRGVYDFKAEFESNYRILSAK